MAAPWTAETARIEALRLLGEAANGSDPAADKQIRRKVTTVTELCDAARHRFLDPHPRIDCHQAARRINQK
jgi:hypothetical protein